MNLTVRSADSHVRWTPKGSVYVVFTARVQRASSGSCLALVEVGISDFESLESSLELDLLIAFNGVGAAYQRTPRDELGLSVWC